MEPAPADTRLKAGVARQGTQNGLEKNQGVLAGLAKGDILARKKAIDDQTRAWAAQPGHEVHAAAIARLDAMNLEKRKTARADADWGNAIGGSRLLGEALGFVRLAEEREKPDSDRKPGWQDRDLPRRRASEKQFARQFDPILDRAGFRLALLRAAELPAEERPWLATFVGAESTIDAAAVDAALDALYATTRLADEAVRIDLLDHATPDTLRAGDDPFVRLAVALWPIVKEREQKSDRDAGERALLSPRYAEAMRAALDGNLAPDANGTLRVTYGTVRPFGADDPPFTTVRGLVAKATGTDPYDAPKAELDAIAALRFGPYVAPDLGEVPVDFIADLDITGGNSGSPALDRDGELVGLAFDGNLEGVASDVLFDHRTTRTIIADMRYLLWYLDAVAQADALVTELGGAPGL